MAGNPTHRSGVKACATYPFPRIGPRSHWSASLGPGCRTPHLNGRQRLLLLRFTYVNDRVQQGSERIQPGALIEIARSIMKRSIRPLGLQVGLEMRRKVMSCSAK